MPHDAAWIVPAVAKGAKVAYDHSEELAQAFGLIKKWFRRQKHIMFTGMSGVGKTVLFDYLVGEGSKIDYRPPEESSKQLEHTRRSIRKTGFALSVVPGEKITPRYRAQKEAIKKYGPPNGIIHVVANGFASIRKRPSQNALIRKGLVSVADFREHQKEQELADLEKTISEVIYPCHWEGGFPEWLMVVATKADLYPSEIAVAENYYSPDGEGRFVGRMNELQEELGTRYFRWQAKPVCSWLENFQWNQETVESKIYEAQRNQMLLQLVQSLVDC